MVAKEYGLLTSGSRRYARTSGSAASGLAKSGENADAGFHITNLASLQDSQHRVNLGAI